MVAATGQETVVAVAVAVAVADNKLEGWQPPTRDYGNKRQQRETAKTVDWQR